MVPDHVILLLFVEYGLGPRKVRAILNTYPEVTSWPDLLGRNLARVEGISSTLVERLQSANPDMGRRILDKTHDLKARYIHYWHDDYPPLLKELYDAPVGLYVRGAGSMKGDFLGIVGARQPTAYGRKHARTLAHEVIATGLGIVSGFARGIDSIAHRAALETGGPTIAVLGCGVDVIYPVENRKLYQTLLEHGLSVSEYPPGTKPDGHHFPRRNRIISGLSLGVLVVEAGIGSGALITAYHANDNGRVVYALPGPVDSAKSAGCHELIQDGAKLVGRVEDILAELPSPYAAPPGQQLDLLRDLPGPERDILEYMDGDPVVVDQIAEDLNRDISELLSVLLHLEMKGLVIQTAGKRFSRA